MTVVHTYFYIVVDTQRGCHTLKKSYAKYACKVTSLDTVFVYIQI